ncbi:MAG: cysteine desulfurase [Clostridia bacterium]|nr:cysteine desulfurase [Clostridia bacterium]
MERIYFDHAATTPLDKEAFEKAAPYYTEFFGNADSPHSFGRKAQAAVDQARDKIAELLGAKPSEIYFTSGGTESDNWALTGCAEAKRKEGKNKVLISAIEHHAVLETAQKLAQNGFEIGYIPVNEQGRVEISALLEMMDEHVAVVAVMAANNETGVVQPCKEIAKIAHSWGALYFMDAVQLAPYARINVKEIEADAVAISAHKCYGPKGVGALYIKEKVKVGKLIVGGEQERGMRGGTTAVPQVVAFACAYEKCVQEAEETAKKMATYKKLFLQELAELEFASVNGDVETSPTGVVNLKLSGVENAAFLYSMDLQGVAISAGSACASASVKPSHVLLAMGLSEAEVKNSVRFSFGKGNTEEEIVRGAKIVKETARKIKNA